MRTALLVSGDDALRARLARALESHAVFAASSDGDALKILRDTGIDLIIKDASPTAGEAVDFIARVRQIRPSSVVLCVVPTETASPNEKATDDDADFVLLQPFTTRHLQGVLRQVADKVHLLQEVAALRAARLLATSVSMAEPGPRLGTASHIPTQVLRELAKVLAAGFDLPRVLDLFLDVVSELMHPSRSAILLADPGSRRFRVRASRGLAPHLVQSVILSAEDGLPLWLAAEGRLIGAEEARAHASDPGAHEIAREMALLQAVLAVPMLAHGELQAILTVGQRITGGAYQQPEDEVIFNLATHLAGAIRDIRQHHLLRDKKDFSERILAHMSSGVVAISQEERVILMNRRAEEILGMAARDVLGHDLRILPSPLGDMLFEALSRGRTITRAEIHLALPSLPLEVSTYPVAGDGAAPIGGVLVFEDLTARAVSLPRSAPSSSSSC